MSSTLGIKLQPNTAYRLNVGGAIVWIEEVRPFPAGPLGVFPPEQDPEAYVAAIPGSTRKKPIGCFALGEVVELSPYNRKFVDDLPALRKAKVETVAPPKGATAAPGRRRPATRGTDVKRYAFVKPNPAFKPGTQSGLIQSALQSLDKPTKQEIADACSKNPAWKWTADAAFKGARWYVDLLVREGYAKEI